MTGLAGEGRLMIANALDEQCLPFLSLTCSSLESLN